MEVAGEVKFVLELKAPEDWKFHSPGFWVTVAETTGRRAPSAWHQVNQAFPGELDSLFERQAGPLYASVGEKVWLDEDARAALVRLWLAAVDDCLGS